MSGLTRSVMLPTPLTYSQVRNLHSPVFYEASYASTCGYQKMHRMCAHNTTTGIMVCVSAYSCDVSVHSGVNGGALSLQKVFFLSLVELHVSLIT